MKPIKPDARFLISGLVAALATYVLLAVQGKDADVVVVAVGIFMISQAVVLAVWRYVGKRPMSRSVLGLGLVVAVALSGCSTQVDATEEVESKSALLEKHMAWTCGVHIDGHGGAFLNVKECTGVMTDVPKTEAVFSCTGINGNTNIIPYGNRQVAFTIAYYTPDHKYEALENFVGDVESGESSVGTCKVAGPTDGFGTYEIHFNGSCAKDDQTWLPGFQSEPEPCNSVHKEKVSKEGFF